METREFWFFVSLLTVAIPASVSLTTSAIYIPLKKFPAAIRDVASFWYQKLYVALVFSLFATLVGLGVYVPLVYESLKLQNLEEIVRSALFIIYTVSLFFLTLSFKKQTLSTGGIVAHSFFASMLLVVGTQENTLDFLSYLYVLIILALFAIVRYGVSTFSKKL